MSVKYENHPGFRKDEIKSAYRSLGKAHSFYDGMMTGSTRLGMAVVKMVWQMDREDMTFVQDAGWYKASANYADFIRHNEKGHVLYLEIGVGANTPVIIKFPFWSFTYDNPEAVYACLNYNEAFAPKQIEARSIIIAGDTGEVFEKLNQES